MRKKKAILGQIAFRDLPMPGDIDFQLLFEESPDVLIVLSPDSPRFTVVAATKARLVATHSTMEGTLGRGLFELFPDNPDDPSANATANLRASLERVLATKAPDTMAVQKYDIPLPDGTFESKYWSPRNIPILSAAGEVSYILHRAVDVTELARVSEAGDELRERTEDMKREVVRRSRELDAANRELRGANEKLNQLDAAKTAFFSNISHEFRTPLTLMLGPLEDCLADASGTLSDAHRTLMTLAHDNALRLMKLVNALLDFSRLEAGRLKGSFAPCDLGRITEYLAGMFQSAFDGAGVALKLDCPPSGGFTYVDVDMWERIVLNLVSNAFKFTLAGEVSVTLRDSQTHSVLEVTDTGSGIPASELPMIFERFHRVPNVASRTHEGAGIGLALVRDLVTLHGGKVSVQSTVGVGTKFRVELPKGFAHLPPEAVVHDVKADYSPAKAAFAREAEHWSSSKPLQNTSGKESATSSPKARILLVDDNADLRDYMSGLLREHYTVTTANDGVEAFEAIQSELPDIVLSDVMMPRLNGMELVQTLRASAKTVNLPIILLSARAGGEAAIEGLDAGSDDYLTKPFTAQELLARVRAHLRLAQLRRSWAADLELANRELDAFSYSVSHDLRAPLRAIEGFGRMMLEEDAEQLGAEGRQRLDFVLDGVKRMSQLIEDLLYLAKVTQGEPRRARFDLSALVRIVASQLNETERGRRVDLHILDDVWVDADPKLIQIVLENLLRNAWKFTAKREVAQIEFGASTKLEETCYFVRDNGAGFDMAFASKLFGVFQRLHSASEFEGTGIGLATVKRIIGRHGGRIWATGERGVGATFYFTLDKSMRA
jgi:signal transduction histidine kinase